MVGRSQENIWSQTSDSCSKWGILHPEGRSPAWGHTAQTEAQVSHFSPGRNSFSSLLLKKPEDLFSRFLWSVYFCSSWNKPLESLIPQHQLKILPWPWFKQRKEESIYFPSGKWNPVHFRATAQKETVQVWKTVEIITITMIITVLYTCTTLRKQCIHIHHPSWFQS